MAEPEIRGSRSEGRIANTWGDPERAAQLQPAKQALTGRRLAFAAQPHIPIAFDPKGFWGSVEIRERLPSVIRDSIHRRLCMVEPPQKTTNMVGVLFRM
jgi:hypothetical protein